MAKSRGGGGHGQVTSAVLKGGQSQLGLLLPSAMSHNLFEQRRPTFPESPLVVEKIFCEPQLKGKCK